MKARLMRRNAGFFPESPIDEDNLKRIKPGQTIEVEYKKPRNPQFHRKFFALLGVVLDNQDRHDSIDSLLIELKLQMAHYDLHVTMGGKSIYIPKSIAFHRMDDDEFAKFYDRALTVILKRFIQGATAAEINRQVDEIVGFL